ncbi:MAG: tetratricopeptide repeat protein [Candidatus Omnitrophica bacterium]|nr:tetratricopeptide repeat protein [Candidatus Omnitrophota bacterium]
MNKKSQSQAKTTLWQRVALILLGVFLSLVILETGLRWAGFVFTSIQGYQNWLSVSQKGSYRIMCLGESTTAGSYPRQLETILNESGLKVKFSVINRGYAGTNTSVILSHLEENLDKYKPDMVITMMGVNDNRNYVFYQDNGGAKAKDFLHSLRTYKLMALLWASLRPRVEKEDLYDVKKSVPLMSFNDTEIKTYCNHLDTLDESSLQSFPEEGRLEAVERFYKKLTDLCPESDRLYYFKGLIYLEEKEAREAKVGEEFLKKAIEMNPRNSDAYTMLGECYRDRKEYDQAVGLLEKAIDANPHNDRAYTLMGLIYLEQQKYADALNIFKKAITFNPNVDRYYGGLLLVCQAMKGCRDSQEYYREIQRIRSSYYSADTVNNYRQVKKILDKRGVKLVCVQYPMRSLAPLRKIFEGEIGALFVDNEGSFKAAIQKSSWRDYFYDIFGGDFGHATQKGDGLLAKNIADSILKRYFNLN